MDTKNLGRLYVVAVTMICVIGVSVAAAVALGQQPTLQAGAKRGCFQDIVVLDKHTKKIRQFTRHGEKLYGEWLEETPVPWAKVKSYVIREWAVKPEAVKKVVGEKLFKLMADNNKVVQSGHFNLSGDPDYDWDDFGGDTFTTTDMKRGRLPRELLGEQGSKLASGS
jgi:hypothetical protein